MGLLRDFYNNMIDKAELTEFLESRLADTGYFLVDVSVSPENEIKVEIDNLEGVDIDHCVELTHEIEARFDRDVEDYELEVGSAGLTSPFKVKGQYLKNIGNKIEVLTKSGEKLKGTLTEVGDDSFVMEIEVKVRKDGAKRPVVEIEQRAFAFDDTKSVKCHLEF